MERTTEEMKLWLFDLAHGNLSDDAILTGFIKHYVLFGLTIDNLVDNIVFRTNYGVSGVTLAKQSLLRVLEEIASDTPSIRCLVGDVGTRERPLGS